MCAIIVNKNVFTGSNILVSNGSTRFHLGKNLNGKLVLKVIKMDTVIKKLKYKQPII